MDIIQAGFIAVASGPPPSASYILLENGDNILAENNDLLTQE